jgi:hypothetical protein
MNRWPRSSTIIGPAMFANVRNVIERAMILEHGGMLNFKLGHTMLRPVAVKATAGSLNEAERAMARRSKRPSRCTAEWWRHEHRNRTWHCGLSCQRPHGVADCGWSRSLYSGRLTKQASFPNAAE